MKVQEVTKDKRELKTVGIFVRTTKKKSEFMKKNNISPTLLFNSALDQLENETVSKRSK